LSGRNDGFPAVAANRGDATRRDQGASVALDRHGKSGATTPHSKQSGRTLLNKRAKFLTTLEILNRAFVFLCRSLAVERAEIFSHACFPIFLAGIQPIFSGLQFPDHQIRRCFAVYFERRP
jgi:hypothetical protein